MELYDLKQIKKILLIVLFTASALSLYAGANYEDLYSSKHIYGPVVRPSDLKGKVVLLEYWGIMCPPCRASYPHLVKLQKKFASTGKFTVLASHVQKLSPEVIKFLRVNKVNFPVYQVFFEPKAPCGRMLPTAILLDYKGKVVAKGMPSELYDKVEALVLATPEPILTGVKVVYCQKEAKVLLSGKPVAKAISELKEKSFYLNEEGDEAKKIISAFFQYVAKKKIMLSTLASTQPDKALSGLKKLALRVSGLSCESAIKKEIQKLSKEKITSLN